MVDPADLVQSFPQLMAAFGDWIGELPGWIEAAVARDPRQGYLALGLAMLQEAHHPAPGAESRGQEPSE